MYHPNFKDTLATSPYIFTLGVAGDSGSGKTTFTEGIRNIFGDDLVSTITLDDYHRLDREGRRKHGLTALNPEANDLIRLQETSSFSNEGYRLRSQSTIIRQGLLMLR